MDLYKAIGDLYEELKRLDGVIASLEEAQRRAGSSPAAPAGKRRGRKSMNTQERRKVSQRMKQYWATRRDGPTA